jgi:LacI family transcriptional regulator
MNLKELAQVLGLSQTTVSRAINGYPEVSEATRRRVEAAAREHNYRPNSRAKSLATGRAMVIGHVIPRSTQHELVNPIFGDFLAGAAQIYARHGYDLMISQVDDQDVEQAYRSLYTRGAVDGVVLQGPKIDEPRIALLSQLDVPFVVHGRASLVSQPYSWVDVNNKRAFQRATEFLLDLGHRRIALINGLEGMDFADRRRTGYLKALQSAGIEADPNLMGSSEMTEVHGHEMTKAMLASKTPPTAILVASMISALGVRRAIEEAGLRLGRDVSVITHDDELSYLTNGKDVPIFTATRSSVRYAGEKVAEMLIERIANPHGAPCSLLLEAELILGQSTGPAPQD